MKDLLILAYHRVLPDVKGTGGIAVSCKDLEKQLIYLKNKKYTFITLEELAAKIDQKLTEKYCVITFDDGYKDNYSYALPILKQLNIPATIFLTVNNIGTKEPFYWDLKNKTLFTESDQALSWDEIKEMKAAGMEFGSHTLSHYELPLLEEEEMIREAAESKKIIDDKLNQNTLSFCYPRGNYRDDLAGILKDCGYKIAVVTPYIDKLVETNYTLKRVGIYTGDNMLKFKIKVSGLFSFWRKIRRS